MAQWANLISHDDMITSGRTRLKARLAESELVSLLTTLFCFLIKEKKSKNKKRIKRRKKNKRRPTMLTVFGHPPCAASEEKTPQSGVIRKVTDNDTT